MPCGFKCGCRCGCGSGCVWGWAVSVTVRISRSRNRSKPSIHLIYTDLQARARTRTRTRTCTQHIILNKRHNTQANFEVAKKKQNRSRLSVTLHQPYLLHNPIPILSTRETLFRLLLPPYSPPIQAQALTFHHRCTRGCPRLVLHQRALPEVVVVLVFCHLLLFSVIVLRHHHLPLPQDEEGVALVTLLHDVVVRREGYLFLWVWVWMCVWVLSVDAGVCGCGCGRGCGKKWER